MALTDKLSSIADAIRAKTGNTDSMTLEQMPTEIGSISAGRIGFIKAIVETGNPTALPSSYGESRQYVRYIPLKPNAQNIKPSDDAGHWHFSFSIGTGDPDGIYGAVQYFPRMQVGAPIFPDGKGFYKAMVSPGKYNDVMNCFTFVAYSNIHSQTVVATKPDPINAVLFPAVRAKLTVLDSVLQSTLVRTYDVAQYNIDREEYDGELLDQYYASAMLHCLYFPYVVDDLLMSVELEYPKYNVTISGTGIEYSLDDGRSFQILDGNANIPNAIEHIVLRNPESWPPRIVKMPDGQRTIFGNEQIVLVPNSDGNWIVT